MAIVLLIYLTYCLMLPSARKVSYFLRGGSVSLVKTFVLKIFSLFMVGGLCSGCYGRSGVGTFGVGVVIPRRLGGLGEVRSVPG